MVLDECGPSAYYLLVVVGLNFLSVGFTHEATFRQHMVVKGHNRDTAWFAMLEGECAALRRAAQSLAGSVAADFSVNRRDPVSCEV